MAENNNNDAGSNALLESRTSQYVALTFTLLVGVVLALLVFQYMRDIEYQGVRGKVEQGLTSLSGSNEYLGPVLEEIGRRMNRLAADVTDTDEVSPALLESYIFDLPGTQDSAFVEFEYIEPRQGEAYRKVLGSAGRRAESDRYRRYESDPMQQFALNHARETGTATAYVWTPLDNSINDLSISRHFLPVYTENEKPGSVSERNRLRGFVVATLYFDLDRIGAFVPSAIRGIQATFHERQGEAEAIGDELAGIRSLTSLDFTAEGAPWRVVGRATPALIDRELTSRPWWVAAAILIVTALIILSAYRANARSAEVMRLVEARTRELNERTQALEEANQALKESEARYKMLADNATDVIYTHDLEGICSYVSPAIYVQRGYTPEEVIGTDLMSRLAPESAARARAGLEDAKRLVQMSPERLGGFQVKEFDAVRKDGTVITIENTTSFLFDDDRNVIGVLGVSRDVTERRRAEQEKEELEDAWRHAQKMEAIGTLAGGVAHDFNNLLTGILGYTDLLKQRTGDDDRLTNGIAVIEKAATRAQELTSQLLGFARKGKYQNVPVDLNESVRDVMSFLERTIDKNIELDNVLSEERPTMVGDPGQINQLLLNLAVNARDAMPQGGTLRFETRIIELDEIFCRAHPGTKPGTYNLILVSDTGVGMAKETMDRIFEPFFTDKEQGKGTGMGLAMVYGVATSHDGTVTVYSEEGLGSTFRVYLPYVNVASRLRDERRTYPVHGTGRIMVVDDEEMLRDLADMMLGDLGYEVVTAQDGIEAVEYYREHGDEIDLLIIDMIMPRMGGVECLAALKDINPDVRAVMSTGYSSAEYASRVLDENIVGFLQKPFRQQELSEIVVAALRRTAVV